MRSTLEALKLGLVVSTAVALCGVACGAAQAGGFAIREQSAQFQGSSFAGNAAGGGLSSMFWNPAALGQAGAGLTSESHFAGIWGQAENTVEAFTFGPGGGALAGTTQSAQTASGVFGNAPIDSGNIGSPALVGSSYYAYKLSEKLTLGMSMNSGFGLTTKPRNLNYLGAELGQTTKLFTLNAAPTLAYKIAPGITIGAGLQVQYARAKFSFAAGAPIGPSAVYKDADDFAFGATAGILFEPAPGTSIGLGYRSQLSHTLEGDYSTFIPNGQGGLTAVPTFTAEADLDLPDIVTLSVRQAIAPNMRLLGTVEWSNWSRFKKLDLINPATGTSALRIPLEANWNDGWFFALGGEYDLNPGMTLRAGAAYEISPVDSAEKRFTTIPDNDRVWLSAGATVKLTESIAADFSYTHVFVENGDFRRETQAGNIVEGYSEAQVDIFSASLKTTWGGGRPLEPLK